MDKDRRAKLEETSEKNYPMVRQEMAAMLTIEERADEYIGHPFKEGESFSVTMERDAYIKGAADQKNIDDAELAEVKRERDEYYDELLSKRQRIVELEAQVAMTYDKKMLDYYRTYPEVVTKQGDILTLESILEFKKRAIKERKDLINAFVLKGETGIAGFVKTLIKRDEKDIRHIEFVLEERRSEQ